MATLAWALEHQVIVIALAGGALAVAFSPSRSSAANSCRPWKKAISGCARPCRRYFLRASGQLVTEIRRIFGDVPEVIDVASQLGRPDDGTDPTSFFNAEFLVTLKPRTDWRPSLKTSTCSSPRSSKSSPRSRRHVQFFASHPR